MMRPNPVPGLLRLLPAAAAALFAACGTGGGGGDEPSVSSLSASPVRYGGAMTVNVSGNNLLQDVQMLVDGGCDAVRRGQVNTDSSAQFVCDVSAIGPLVLRVLGADGRELGRLRVEVPVPQVSMTVEQGRRSGSFTVELDPQKAPLTVRNFLAYVRAGFYEDVIFHRVVAGFVVQAGGFTSGPTVKPPTRAAIALESANGLSNRRGTIAMARTSAPDSATSQFYVNLVDNAALDFVDAANPGYAVFGRVISGLEVIDEIGAVPVEVNPATGLTHLPVDDVTIVEIQQTR